NGRVLPSICHCHELWQLINLFLVVLFRKGDVTSFLCCSCSIFKSEFHESSEVFIVLKRFILGIDIEWTEQWILIALYCFICRLNGLLAVIALDWYGFRVQLVYKLDT